MNTHEYTDDQIQTAIDAAFPQAGPSYLANLDTSPDTRSWPEEALNRLAIARAFLAALPKPEPAPYARLKAYAAAGARIRIRFSPTGPWTPWHLSNNWYWCNHPADYEVHPDDLHMVPEYAPKPAETSAEPKQAWANADNAKAFEQFQAEIEDVWEGKPTDGPQAAQYHTPKLPNPLAPLWTLKPGDVVRLKSGGPRMTIERFDAQASEAFCVMVYAGGVYRGVFQVATIELANP